MPKLGSRTEGVREIYRKLDEKSRKNSAIAEQSAELKDQIFQLIAVSGDVTSPGLESAALYLKLESIDPKFTQILDKITQQNFLEITDLLGETLSSSKLEYQAKISLDLKLDMLLDHECDEELQHAIFTDLRDEIILSGNEDEVYLRVLLYVEKEIPALAELAMQTINELEPAFRLQGYKKRQAWKELLDIATDMREENIFIRELALEYLYNAFLDKRFKAENIEGLREALVRLKFHQNPKIKTLVNYFLRELPGETIEEGE